MRRILFVVLLVATAVAVPNAVAHAADVQFTLTTNYTGLYPDADVSVPVTVHNPATYDLASEFDKMLEHFLQIQDLRLAVDDRDIDDPE